MVTLYSTAELYSTLANIQGVRYGIIAMFSVQIYELIASAGWEFRLIHRAPWSSMKILYLLCRYYPLLVWILISWAYVGDHTWAVCNKATYPVHALLAPCQFFSQAVMVMRAYAFSGRKWSVKILLTMCYAALLGVDLWVFCGPLGAPPEVFYIIMGGKSGCFPNYGGDFKAIPIGYSMLAATLMDFVSLIVMLIHGRRSGYDSVALGRYFINQGVAAFGFVCCVNIGAAVAFFRPPLYHDGIGLPLVVSVSNIVACRIILRLREKVCPTETELARQHSLLVRNAFISRQPDAWIIEEDSLH